jgi:hypothetical protein
MCAICIQTTPSWEDGQQLAKTRRIFPNKGALSVHQRAKHFGVHLDIKPNWHLWKYGSNGGLARMNDVKIDDHGGEDADPRELLIAPQD